MPNAAWLSAHLHFAGGIYDDACDAVLLNVIGPLASDCAARKWARGFFFVRYGDDGSHVRLRILGAPEHLTTKVVPALTDVIGPGMGRAAPLISHVAWQEYAPEVERYGGPHGVAVAERLFQHCSRHSLALLAGMKGSDRSERLGRGLVPLLVLLRGFVRDRATSTAIAHAHGHNTMMALVTRSQDGASLVKRLGTALDETTKSLRPQVVTVLRALRDEKALPSHVREYQSAVRTIASELRQLVRRRAIRLSATRTPSWQQAVRALLPSYVHMACNRMGIAPLEEAYLSLAVARAWPAVRRRPPAPGLTHD